MNCVWDVYEKGIIEQEFTSKRTSRKQTPAIFKVLKSKYTNVIIFDIGCGKYEKDHINYFENNKYLGVDPFNKTKESNNKSLDFIKNNKADVVVIANVLNTIKEPSVWNTILKQSFDALKDEGEIYISIYEGAPLKSEIGVDKKNLSPIETSNGWQNRFKIEKYLDYIKETYPSAILKSEMGVKYIYAKK